MESTTMISQSSVVEPIKLGNLQLVVKSSESWPSQHAVRMNIAKGNQIAHISEDIELLTSIELYTGNILQLQAAKW